MTNYTYINSSGLVVADTSAIQSEVQQEYKDTFGEDLIVTSDTPQGVLIDGETLSRADVVQNNAALANQINPNIAGGIFLDAIGALSGIDRIESTRTTVTAQLTGVPLTLIPAFSRARTSAGDLFESVSGIVLDSSGDGEVEFRSIEYGEISCLAGELNTIVSGILGWETVTNDSDATLGKEEQSDEGYRAYRRNTLAFQAVSLSEAITSALYATEGVLSLSYRENPESTTETIDGVSMDPHSIFACVDGGTDLDVATAILENKSQGSPMMGDQVVPVVDPASGQTYNVKFYRPTEIDILIRATVKYGTSADVKSAILEYVNGEIDGEDGFVVGADVSPFELAGAINNNFPSIYVKKVEISLTGTVSYSTDEIEIGVLEKASTEEGYITVVVET